MFENCEPILCLQATESTKEVNLTFHLKEFPIYV